MGGGIDMAGGARKTEIGGVEVLVRTRVIVRGIDMDGGGSVPGVDEPSKLVVLDGRT